MRSVKQLSGVGLALAASRRAAHVITVTAADERQPYRWFERASPETCGETTNGHECRSE